MNRSSTSPFRSTAMRGGSSESAQMIIRTLEQENNSLVEQIGILKAKGKKVHQLEDKIDMILRHNTQLLNENQRLAKLINQKKSQVEIWKNKHDSLLSNKSSASDLQVKRLLNEIQKLKEEGCQIEHSKNLQINEIKNQQHLEIQTLKRNNLSNAEKYQLEIRKLKEYCDKKDYQVSDLKMKIARISKETDFQIGKLREQKERMRSDLQYEEAEHRKEVQSLKSKFDYNFHSEIENLKKQHLNQVETLDYENSKLKEVINSKNLELEQAMAKQTKMRNHYEDSIDLLKKENDELKDKLVQNQHIADLELNNLREKMEGIKESQIAILKDAHANQCDILNRQIMKLNKFLESRNEEIEILAKERNQMRQALEAQVLKAKAALDAQINDNRIAAARHEEAIKVCDEDLKQKNQQMKTLEAYLNTQIEGLRVENAATNKQLESRQAELNKQRQQSRDEKAKLDRQISSLREQCSSLKDELERNSRRANSDSEDLKKMFQLKITQLETKIKGLEEENKQKDNLIEELRQNIRILDAQIKTTNQKVQFLQNTEKELRSQARDNFNKWDAKEKQLNRLIREQIEGMERIKKNEIEELKSIQDNKVRTLKHQIKELERHIEDKNRNLNELKTRYDELVNKFEEIFSQEAARKNLDIKSPGWIPDTIATKSLFDVFLKNKVLEYCS